MSQITNSGPTLATVAGSGPAAFGVVALAPFLLRRIMQGAANSFPADLQTPKDVLSPDELKRIEAIWQTTEWPEGTDAYAKAAFGRPFASYVERIRHLGLSGTLLIDAGCGAGEWSFAWATRFERVLGFDTAPERTSAAIFQKNRPQTKRLLLRPLL